MSQQHASSQELRCHVVHETESGATNGAMHKMMFKKSWRTLVQVIVLVLSCVFVYFHWSQPMDICKKSDERCQKKQKTQNVSTILQTTMRVFFVVVLFLQITAILHIRVTPVVASIGVFLAAVGYAFQAPIQDYVVGASFAFSNKLDRYDTVVFTLYGQTEKIGPLFITNLYPLVVEGADSEGQTHFVRYSVIDAIERVAQSDQSTNTLQ